MVSPTNFHPTLVGSCQAISSQGLFQAGHRLGAVLLLEEVLSRETEVFRRRPVVCVKTVPLKLQGVQGGLKEYRRGISSLCYNN